MLSERNFIIFKYAANYNLKSISKIFNNNNKFVPEFQIKSGYVLPIIGQFNERIPENTEIVSFFVNNIPMVV